MYNFIGILGINSNISMNNTVNATGMRVRTKVSDNLFITGDTLASNATITDDDEYMTSYVITSDTYLLEPVSTVDGKAFFYTSTDNVENTGDAKSDAYIAYAEGDAFDENYGVNDTTTTADAKGYVDYVFQLKAINTSSSDSKLVLTELNLKYGGSADASNAFRVAIFVEALDVINNATGITAAQNPAGNLDALDAKIFAPSGADHFTDGKAVSDVDELDDVTYVSANTEGKWNVGANTTSYFKVVVRLWLEGEDKTCNNTTFASLTDDWALDLTFKLSATDNAVVNLGQATTAAKIDLTGATSSSTKELSLNGVDYYLLKTVSSVKYYVTTANLPSASATRVYTISGGKVYDVTNQVTLTD